VQHSFTHLAGLKVRAEDFFAAVLEATAEPIWVVDPDDMIRFANPAAITALGYDDAADLFGRRSDETIPAAGSPTLLPRATGETVARDLDWFVRRDGSMVPVSYVSGPMDMPGGRGAVVAFSEAEDRVRGEHLRHEHEAILAAQRRVATLVAGGAGSADVFAAIAREVGRVIDVPLVAVWRYERDGTATVIGAWGEHPHPFEAGTRWPLDGPTICARVLESGRPARIDDFAGIPGTIADAARKTGIRSCAGAPIVVDGTVWGAISTDSEQPLPADTEARLVSFTELLAAAIANAESRAGLAQLAEEQAALRRVATLVARGAPPDELFAAVVEEVRRVLPADIAGLARYEPDRTCTVVAVAGWTGDSIPTGHRWSLEGQNINTIVFDTGRPARIDSYANASGELGAAARQYGVGSAVGTPVFVEGHLWGVMSTYSTLEQAMPADTEARLGSFTELVATAISNTDARMEAGRLAREQAALRRVATLVAEDVPASRLFPAVAEEVGKLLGADLAGVARYESDHTVTVVATWDAAGEAPDVAARWPLEEGDLSTMVWRTGQSARMEGHGGVSPRLAGIREELGIRSSVASPIVVDGRPWGGLVVHSKQTEALPSDTEARLENFSGLVATAISNVQARSDLGASRARIVAATDEERRRVVRDLHDGAQQRLVHTIITLKLARRALRSEKEDLAPLLAEALEHAERATAELRELAHGILPAVLTHGGLRAGIDALASRTPVPVEIDVSVARLTGAVEATAYFVVAEALTNVAKHSRAGHAAVSAHIEDGVLCVQVRDDGIGGARPDGSGLLGLADRLAALDGHLRLESPPGGGTLVAAAIPLPASS
jgi:PAS domain S-box-containing protein